MPQIDDYEAKIRVFKWDVKLPGCPQYPLVYSYGGVFLIRATTVFPTPTAPEGEYYTREVVAVPYPMHKILHLLNLNMTEGLLQETFKWLRLLRSCKNLDLVVQLLAAELVFKFRFTPEFLIRRPPKLVIFLDLVIILENLNYLPAEDIVRMVYRDENLCKYPDGDHNNGRLILGEIGEIEDFLKGCRGINAVDPKGMVEVKAGLEVKVFDKDDDISVGREDDSQVKECPICFEKFRKGAVVAEMACSHMFHRPCLFKWLFRTNSCPMCRSSFSARD